MQVDTWARGFSYAYDAPLDMRMDPEQELTAEEIVNTWDERRLARLFREYGEERYSNQIARAIVRARRREELELDPAAGRRDQVGGAGAGAVRRRPSRHAHVPGAADRRQRRARPARGGAAGGLGPARARRPAGGDLVPLARGPARQAVPGRSRARLHLPARVARSASAAASPRRSCSPAVQSRRHPGEVAANPRSRSAHLRAARKLEVTPT